MKVQTYEVSRVANGFLLKPNVDLSRANYVPFEEMYVFGTIEEVCQFLDKAFSKESA